MILLIVTSKHDNQNSRFGFSAHLYNGNSTDKIETGVSNGTRDTTVLLILRYCRYYGTLVITVRYSRHYGTRDTTVHQILLRQHVEEESLATACFCTGPAYGSLTTWQKTHKDTVFN